MVSCERAYRQGFVTLDLYSHLLTGSLGRATDLMAEDVAGRRDEESLGRAATPST